MVDGMLKFKNCAGTDDTHTAVRVIHRVQARSRLRPREVVLDPQLTGSRRDQEEGGGAGPSTTGSRRDQEEGGGAGPSTYRVQARSRLRREVVLDPQLKGSRRDQEEGGGAGPSSYPRRDHEQGDGAGL